MGQGACVPMLKASDQAAVERFRSVLSHNRTHNDNGTKESCRHEATSLDKGRLSIRVVCQASKLDHWRAVLSIPSVGEESPDSLDRLIYLPQRPTCSTGSPRPISTCRRIGGSSRRCAASTTAANPIDTVTVADPPASGWWARVLCGGGGWKRDEHQEGALKRTKRVRD